MLGLSTGLLVLGAVVGLSSAAGLFEKGGFDDAVSAWNLGPSPSLNPLLPHSHALAEDRNAFLGAAPVNYFQRQPSAAFKRRFVGKAKNVRPALYPLGGEGQMINCPRFE